MQATIILLHPDAMKMYESTLVTLKDDKMKKCIYDGWIQFVSDNILHMEHKICCSLDFTLNDLFVEIARAYWKSIEENWSSCVEEN